MGESVTQKPEAFHYVKREETDDIEKCIQSPRRLWTSFIPPSDKTRHVHHASKYASGQHSFRS